MKQWLKWVTVAAALALTACGGGKPAEDQAAQGEQPAVEKTYKVGVNAAFAPFESVDPSGKMQGFDIELTQAVADAAGIKVEMVNTPWEGIFAGLDNGDQDLLVSAITITGERKASMDFTEPYFEATQLVVLPKGKTLDSADALKNMKVSVLTGSTGDTVAQKLMGATSTNIKRFETLPLALKELESGGVQACIGDNGVVANYVANNSGTEFTVIDNLEFDKEYYGMAVRKGNAELLEKLNGGIRQIRDNGTYDQIYQKYFGKL